MNCDCALVDHSGPPLTATCGAAALVFMALIDAFARRRCEISDACGRVAARATPEAEYDFVVVGGGSGGAATAGKLAQTPGWRVLLIEAGGDEPPGSQIPAMVVNYFGDPHLDWNYRTEPEPVACQGYPERRCSWPRGKVLGGCSVINGMMYTRGTPADYRKWAQAGNAGWNWADVLPVFKRFEDNREVGTLVESAYHGVGGPLTTARFRHQPPIAYDILRAAQEIGHNVSDDLNGRQFTGFAIAQSNTRDGVRLSSAKAYVRPQRANRDFHVMLNSTATKILFDGQKTAVAVQFLYRDRLYTVRVRREVILAAGALNTPQILLLSGVGPRQELDKVGIRQVHDLPGVGRNLQNHVAFYMGYKLNAVRAVNDLDWANALDYFLYQTGPMSSTGLSQVTARVNSPYADPSGDDPDLQIFFAGYTANCATSGSVGEPEDPRNPEARKDFTFSPVVLHPKSKGHVRLRSANPLDAPEMVANYLTAPEDVRVLVSGIRLIQRLANSSVMLRYGMAIEREDYGACAETHRYDSDEFWGCAVKYYTGPENHQACSCRMGPESDPLAVVDHRLMVRGLSNVRIADASAMPALVSGNTHATIVMMAERAVDFIKEKWLGGAAAVVNRFGEDARVPGVQAPVTRSPPMPNRVFQHSEAFHKRHPNLPNPYLGYGKNHNYYYEQRQPAPEPYYSS